MEYTDMINKLTEKYSKDDFKTIKGSFHICKFSDDEFLHSFFYGIDNQKESELEYMIGSLKPDISRLNEYLETLKISNGSVLYSGSVVLFGYPDSRDAYEDRPASLIELNKRDSLANSSDDLLYIGNSPFSLGGNINFYFNLIDGTVLGVKDAEQMIKWAFINDFFANIFEKFDGSYADNGINIHYGSKEHFVYNNIQKYII